MPTKFITTKDKLIADNLKEQGFHLVSSSYGIYTFVNNKSLKLNFNADDIKKICYTDKIYV